MFCKIIETCIVNLFNHWASIKLLGLKACMFKALVMQFLARLCEAKEGLCDAPGVVVRVSVSVSVLAGVRDQVNQC